MAGILIRLGCWSGFGVVVVAVVAVVAVVVVVLLVADVACVQPGLLSQTDK